MDELITHNAHVYMFAPDAHPNLRSTTLVDLALGACILQLLDCLLSILLQGWKRTSHRASKYNPQLTPLEYCARGLNVSLFV